LPRLLTLLGSPCNFWQSQSYSLMIKGLRIGRKVAQAVRSPRGKQPFAAASLYPFSPRSSPLPRKVGRSRRQASTPQGRQSTPPKEGSPLLPLYPRFSSGEQPTPPGSSPLPKASIHSPRKAVYSPRGGQPFCCHYIPLFPLGSSPLPREVARSRRQASTSTEGSPLPQKRAALCCHYIPFSSGEQPTFQGSSPFPKVGIYSPRKAVYSPTVRCTNFEFGGTYFTSMVNEKQHSHKIQKLYTVQRKAGLSCQ